jgi:hypothetical protein
MIKPTIGRVVLFKRADAPNQEFPAIICYVHSDRMVNLAIWDANGNPVPQTSVSLLQDDDRPAGDAFWCEWMPYQKGQAAKTEAAEATALELGAAARAAGPSSY